MFPYPISMNYMKGHLAFFLFMPVDVIDIFGRPILETRSIMYSLNPSNFRASHFEGSRAGDRKMVNVGALRHYLSHQRDAELFVQTCRAAVSGCEQMMCNSPAYRAWLVASCGYIAPQLYMLKQSLCCECPNLSDIVVPASVGSVSKICHGLTGLLFSKLTDPDWQSIGFSAETLFQIAETEGFLVKKSSVCAASEKLILNFLTKLLEEEDVDDEAEADRSSSRFDDVVNLRAVLFSKLTMDYVAFFYELFRVLLYKLNKNSVDFPGELKTRGATPFCLDIISLCKSDFPTQAPLVCAMKRIYAPILEVALPRHLCNRILNVSTEMLSAFECGSIGSSLWQTVQQEFLTIITFTDQALQKACGVDRRPIVYHKSDLALVFGNDPLA